MGLGNVYVFLDGTGFQDVSRGSHTEIAFVRPAVSWKEGIDPGVAIV